MKHLKDPWPDDLIASLDHAHATAALTDTDRRMAANAAGVLHDYPHGYVLAVQVRDTAAADLIRAAIERLLAHPAVARVGIAPLEQVA